MTAEERAIYLDLADLSAEALEAYRDKVLNPQIVRLRATLDAKVAVLDVVRQLLAERSNGKT